MRNSGGLCPHIWTGWKRFATLARRPRLVELALVTTLILTGCGRDEAGRQGGREERVAPVEVAPISVESIALVRTFTGTLDAKARIDVAAEVSGRIGSIAFNIGDAVSRGDVVARLDDAEYAQAVKQAESNLAVARANVEKAKSALTIADRDLERTESLRNRELASEAALDEIRSAQLAATGELAVAEAEVERAESEVESARIRLGYTVIRVDWQEGDNQRVVSQRYVDEGQSITANQQIMSVVELTPLTGVFFVTERDYARLHPGQQVKAQLDAFPGEDFTGEIARIAPVFQENSRQARIELLFANEDRRLKPGMFIRVSVELDRVDDAIVVPEQALTSRDGQQGVFLLGNDRKTAHWQPVTVGIRQGDRLQIMGENLEGEVITLGQQLIEDGSPIKIPETEVAEESPNPDSDADAIPGSGAQTPAPAAAGVGA